MNLANSVFDSIEEKAAQYQGEHLYRLDQGKLYDCHLPQAYLSPPSGQSCLKTEVVRYYAMRFGDTLPFEAFVLTSGATHALSIIFQRLLLPDDEVLVLSPHWPLITGIIQAARVSPVEVSLFDSLDQDGVVDLSATLDQYRTPRCRAIYYNSPNNPTGVCLGRKALLALVEYARQHDLFLIADNAYELYDFSEAGFCDPFQLTGYDKCLSIYTFSKSLNIPGYRVGFIVSSSRWHDCLYKASLYTIYALSTIAQFAVTQALSEFTPARLSAQRDQVNRARLYVLEHLRVPHIEALGGYYLWLDFSSLIKAFGSVDLIYEKLFALGVSLTPGQAFGQSCVNSARLCYASVSYDELAEPIRLINELCGY